ncbi:hypothetical protein Nm8I071_43360 [Nonomuraea sp. TT08I-71]|nr:hypothetical protein Nm8I071_43360 [Nonomuraea sp. TT08I-71]
MSIPRQQIRAAFTADTVTVYQAVERPYPLPVEIAQVVGAGAD